MCDYDNISFVFIYYCKLASQYCDSLSCCVCRVNGTQFWTNFNSFQQIQHAYGHYMCTLHILIFHDISMILVWLASRLMAVWMLGVFFFSTTSASASSSHSFEIWTQNNLHLFRAFDEPTSTFVLFKPWVYSNLKNRNKQQK